MRRVLIDTDSGSDDAVAILVALGCGLLCVEGVATVFGNVDVEQATVSACGLLDTARSSADVGRGAAVPLRRRPARNGGEDVHGRSGLGRLTFPPSQREVSTTAGALYIEHLARRPNEIEVLAIAPLTNLAELLAAEPHIFRRIKRLTVMGGSFDGGNMTPFAEYNIAADPEAAAAVLGSGVACDLIGLEVTERAIFDIDIWSELKSEQLRGMVADLLWDNELFHLRRLGRRASVLHDVMAVAALVIPEIFLFEEMEVAVDTSDGPKRGRILPLPTSDHHPLRVAVDVDASAFKEFVMNSLNSLSASWI